MKYFENRLFRIDLTPALGVILATIASIRHPKKQ